jgi:hypothetical protein
MALSGPSRPDADNGSGSSAQGSGTYDNLRFTLAKEVWGCHGCVIGRRLILLILAWSRPTCQSHKLRIKATRYLGCIYRNPDFWPRCTPREGQAPLEDCSASYTFHKSLYRISIMFLPLAPFLPLFAYYQI